MNRILLGALCLLAACSTSNTLEEGRWTGALTPMNHPEMANPVAYDVRYEGDALTIDLLGPGSEAIPTREVMFDGDTLRFVFDEPEEGVPLRCALGATDPGGFAGRCADAFGQWAMFTMLPPGSTDAL